MKQFIRFVFTGVLNTVFYYFLYTLFIYMGIDYKLSVLFATIIGVGFSFKSFSKFVFNNSDNSLIYRFVFIYVVLYFVNITLIKFLDAGLQNYYISGLMATLVCAFLSFVLNKKFVFKG